jgi:hypothetical protein
VLIRAVGPTLTQYGIATGEVLADPAITIHDALNGNAVIATNDNWGDNTNASDITAVGAAIGAAAIATSDTKSSAVLTTLPPGVYSFVISGAGGASGIVLAEVYDADATNTSARLVNISSRADCTGGDGVTIGGYVIGGGAPKRVLIRAVGPSLTAHGISATEVLSDPVIEVHDARNGNVVIATNDNWSDNANAAEIVATTARIGATPLTNDDGASSALLVALPPGVYSFVAQGKHGGTGIVLVEVYDAD